MSTNLKIVGTVFAVTLVAAGVASGGSIKNWTSHETIRASDLNAALNHIHSAAESAVNSSRIQDDSVSLADMANNSVGSAEIVDSSIVNADINSSAAIAHSKLAEPALIPKAWGVAAHCASDPCTISDGSGVDGIARTATGTYTVTLSTARSDALYAPIVSSMSSGAGVLCATDYSAQTTTTFKVYCTSFLDTVGFLATDASFAFLVMDYT